MINENEIMRISLDNKENTFLGDGTGTVYFKILKYEQSRNKETSRATFQRDRARLMNSLKFIIEHDYKKRELEAYLFGYCNGAGISFNDFIEKLASVR